LKGLAQIVGELYTYKHWSKIVSLPSYRVVFLSQILSEKTSFPNLYIPIDENQLNLKDGPGTFPGLFKLYALNVVEQYDV
jgi:hypothetical protein